MRKILVLGALLIAIPSVFAGYGIWYNMSWGMKIAMTFLMVLYFAAACFIFSIIFWLTHNWLVKASKKKKR